MTRRRNGIWSVLAVLMSLGLIAAACTTPGGGPTVPAPAADDADPNGELVTNMGSEPDTIDPHRASFVQEIDQIMSVFEGLMTLDPKTLKPVPAAAAKEPEVSADGLTYTYTLRDGLKFSDGGALTAKDFAFGFTRTCDPATHGEYSFVLYIIKGCEAWNGMDPEKATPAELSAAKAALGIKVVDDKTLQFTLTEPAAYFTSITYMWVGMPARESDVTKGGDKWTEPATYIGNGPFKLVEWKHNEKMVYERNTNYRLPVKLAKWTKVMINESAVAFAAYRNNELDTTGFIAEDQRTIEADPALKSQLVDRGGSCTFYYGMNSRKPPFDDRNVRMAFAKSFDRDAYIRDVQKIGKPANGGFIPPGFPGYDETDNVQKFDVAAAKNLIAQSKYGAVTHAAFTGIKVSYSASAASKTRLEWVQQQWKNNLGVDIGLDPVDGTAYSALLKADATTPQLFSLGWCADFPDQQNWHTTVWHSSATFGAGRVGWTEKAGTRSAEAAQFDTIVRNADKEPDKAKRDAEYLRAGKLLSGDAPAAWNFYNATPYLQKPWVKGVTVSSISAGTLTLLNKNEVYVTKKG